MATIGGEKRRKVQHGPPEKVSKSPRGTYDGSQWWRQADGIEKAGGARPGTVNDQAVWGATLHNIFCLQVVDRVLLTTKIRWKYSVIIKPHLSPEFQLADGGTITLLCVYWLHHARTEWECFPHCCVVTHHWVLKKDNANGINLLHLPD